MSALHAALLDIQKGLRPAKRNQQGESFDWADLPSVLATCQRKLHAKGILIQHFPTGAMHGAVFMALVNTELRHVESGEFINASACCPCPPDRLEYSATVTLLRRVGLACLLGIVQAEPDQIQVNGNNRAHALVDERRRANGVGQ